MTCSVPADWVSNFSQCVYDWQTLAAGVLALIAASFSVYFLSLQIRQQQVHRADDLSRRHNAARLTLPLTLAAVSELTQRIANEVGDEFEKFEPNGSRTIQAVLDANTDRARFDSLALPDNALTSFEDFVASLNDKHDLRHVAELVASTQIMLSRFNDFDLNHIGAPSSLVSLLLDAAKVRLLTDRMYNYARFVEDSAFGIVGVLTVEEAWDQIHAKAQGLVFHRPVPDRFFPELAEQIAGYKKADASPWNEKFEG